RLLEGFPVQLGKVRVLVGKADVDVASADGIGRLDVDGPAGRLRPPEDARLGIVGVGESWGCRRRAEVRRPDGGQLEADGDALEAAAEGRGSLELALEAENLVEQALE